MLAPPRSAHVASWSTAAARNVSAAPTTTLFPRVVMNFANLPMVVVLPTPFTPTTTTTAGTPGSLARRRVESCRAKRDSRTSAKMRRKSLVSSINSGAAMERISEIIESVRSGPKSADNSVSSSSSQSASVTARAAGFAAGLMAGFEAGFSAGSCAGSEATAPAGSTGSATSIGSTNSSSLLGPWKIDLSALPNDHDAITTRHPSHADQPRPTHHPGASRHRTAHPQFPSCASGA